MATGVGYILPRSNVPAFIRARLEDTYTLADSDTLQVVVDGGSIQTVTFSEDDFVDITNATAAEVAVLLDAGLDDVRAIPYSSLGKSYAKLISVSSGRNATLQVVGGTARDKLGFPWGLYRGITIEGLQTEADPQGNKIDLSWTNIGYPGFGVGAVQFNSAGESVTYSGAGLTDSLVQTGCVRFRLRPWYTGAPSVEQELFISSQSKINSNNIIYITHIDSGSGGGIGLYLYDSSGSPIVSYTSGPTWLPVSGNWYWIEVDFDVTIGATRIFVDGVLYGTVQTGTGTRSGTAQYVGLGMSVASDVAAVDIDELQIFDTVQHTAEFETQLGSLITPYSSGLAVLAHFDDYDGQSLDLDYVRDGGSVTATSNGTPSIVSTQNEALWDGRVKILAKQVEYPREHDDSGATEVYSEQFTAGDNTDQTYEVSSLAAGVNYYFTIFFYLPQTGLWSRDVELGYAFAFPYGQWGHSDLLFNKSPKFMPRYDDSGDWAAWLSLFGTVLDGLKTDVEQILTFRKIWEIRADLIPQLDYMLGWPTNYELPESNQRGETERAISLWQKKGRKVSLETPLEQVTNYDVEIMDGWKYVMFHNDPDCVHPDTTDPLVAANKELEDDLLRYHPDIGKWHDVNGWGVFFYYVEGVSELFTQTMIQKVNLLAPIFIPSWTDYSFVVESAPEEETPLAPTDEYDTQVYSPDEAPPTPSEEPIARLESPYVYLVHNHEENEHNDRYRLHPHDALQMIAGDVCILGRFNDITPSFDLDHVRDGGSASASTNGSPTIETYGYFGNYLLLNDSAEYVSFSGVDIVDRAIDYGCVELFVKPNYSGSPASNQYFFAMAQSNSVGNNLVILYHSTGGALYFEVYDSTGSLIFSIPVSWSPISGVWYHLSGNWDTVNGANRLFVDGSQQGSTSSATGTRSSSIGWIGLGRTVGSTTIMNSGIDQLVVYDRVQREANFTVPTGEI